MHLLILPTVYLSKFMQAIEIKKLYVVKSPNNDFASSSEHALLKSYSTSNFHQRIKLCLKLLYAV